MNVDALIDYVMNTPLSWIIMMMSASKVGILIYEKTGKNALLHPILIIAQIPYK